MSMAPQQFLALLYSVFTLHSLAPRRSPYGDRDGQLTGCDEPLP
jgi:hypothetical protein